MAQFTSQTTVMCDGEWQAESRKRDGEREKKLTEKLTTVKRK
jgi:hypothetical protein